MMFASLIMIHLAMYFLQSSRVMQTYWDISSSSPDPFNAANFTTALDGELITIDGVTDAQEKPPFGNVDIEIRAMRLKLDSMALGNEGNIPVIDYIDENNLAQKLIVGAGVSIDFSDLKNYSVGVKKTPLTWGVDAIHFGPR